MKKRLKIGCILLLLYLHFTPELSAQLCQGSLGDPVVNITFGSGTNPGRPISSSTNYTYTSADCPSDGFYTIENSTSNCFGGTWHSVPEDHTPGDINGYMMVVNASFTPGDFFVQTVDGLCPNTTYEFAAWILNVLQSFACQGHGIKPNITFNIETTSGTVLQTYKTGDIPAGAQEWKQYGFYFSTTAGVTSVVLRMTNNAPGGCGNDLLLDDITFRACGPLVTASIVGAPDSVNVCTGDNAVFTLRANVSAGYTDPVYQWQSTTDNGATWNNIAGANGVTYIRPAIASPGVYSYRLTVSERTNIGISSCSIASNTVVISVNTYPVPAASTRGSCIGDTVTLTAADGDIFSWSGPSNFTSSLSSPFIAGATAANNGRYYVKVTSDKGCTTLDSTVVALSSKPLVNAGNDGVVCEGSTITLHSTTSNFTSFQWSPVSEISDPAIADPVAYPVGTTLYVLTASNNECKVADSVTIVVNKNPVVNAGPDKVIIEGQSVMLEGAASGTEVTSDWSPHLFIDQPGVLTPTVDPPANQNYVLKVSSNVGCGTVNDSMLVKVFKKVYIPNAFTPNGDGVNDTWFIETLEAYPQAEVKVFNRYGQKVFDNHGVHKDWDGKFKGMPLSPAVYVYIIDLKNGAPPIKGIVSIIL
jgi:gliding motility-associated-like protein